MAEEKPNFNQDQYDMLKRCSEKRDMTEWNEWRKKNPEKDIFLWEADLLDAELSGANLSEANLCEANLSGATLTNTNFLRANLREASFNGAHLVNAILCGANLNDAHFLFANLEKSDFSKADLSNANLSCGAFMDSVNFRKANLRGADMSAARLLQANLEEANLQDADLSGASFHKAILKKADLTGANLIGSLLCSCTLTDATLTGVILYGSAREDWKIDGVKCDYIFWDIEAKNRTPKDRDFEPGEFESLYKQLPTIEYVFENGFSPLDPVFMDSVVKEISKIKPEYNLKIDSINARGLAPSIRFTVKQEDQKEHALTEIKNGYEREMAKMQGKLEGLQEVIQSLIKQPNVIQNIRQGHGFAALNGSTINVTIEEAKGNIEKIKEVVEKEPVNKSFSTTAKDKAMGILGGALEDVAKDGVKEAAKKVMKLGPLLGTLLSKCPEAFEFFRNIL